MLGALLTRGPSAPFYRALIDSNLGYEFAPSTGYDSNPREGLFAIGLTGVKQEDVNTVVETIHKTLEEVAKEGFEKDRIESILHQIEFAAKNVCLTVDYERFY